MYLCLLYLSRMPFVIPWRPLHSSTGRSGQEARDQLPPAADPCAPAGQAGRGVPRGAVHQSHLHLRPSSVHEPSRQMVSLVFFVIHYQLRKIQNAVRYSSKPIRTLFLSPGCHFFA